MVRLVIIKVHTDVISAEYIIRMIMLNRLLVRQDM